MKFNVENVAVTKAAEQWASECGDRVDIVRSLVVKHMNGDWGEVSRVDKIQNEETLKGEGRLMSCLEAEGSPEKIWVISEADRSVLTVLFPSD